MLFCVLNVGKDEIFEAGTDSLLRQHTFIDLIINKVFSCVQHIGNVNRSDCNSRLNLTDFDFYLRLFYESKKAAFLPRFFFVFIYKWNMLEKSTPVFLYILLF